MPLQLVLEIEKKDNFLKVMFECFLNFNWSIMIISLNFISRTL